MSGIPGTPRRGLQSPELIHAQALADAGKLSEAAALCQARIRQAGPSADAYYILGLVQEASGRGDARDCYRKALYLDPTHYLTLVQLATLAFQSGDVATARGFQQRAQRASAGEQP